MSPLSAASREAAALRAISWTAAEDAAVTEDAWAREMHDGQRKQGPGGVITGCADRPRQPPHRESRTVGF